MRSEGLRPLRGAEIPDDEWVGRLGASGAVRDEAIGRLHAFLLRVARHRIANMVEARDLGATRREELAQTTADEATVAVLRRLPDFEGLSRFTTWAYKFAILRSGVLVRRLRWVGRDVDLDHAPEPTVAGEVGDGLVGRDLGAAVAEALTALTPHQRRVAVAVLVDGVPIDVLAERLGSNRNALYKTIHDARRRLRTRLVASGHLKSPEVIREP